MSEIEKKLIIDKLENAVSKLTEHIPVSFIPDAGTNLAYATYHARILSDLAVTDGGIIVLNGSVFYKGSVKFGVQSNISKTVLTAMKFDQDIRSAGIIHFSEDIIQKADELLLEVRSFDREKEPVGTSTMDWGTAFCCEEDNVPDLIYDRGTNIKEPLIRIFGEDPMTVVNNIIMIAERINNKN
ncbi:MAG: thiamine-phosphate synthase family protein [Methanomicrobium sp.]|nr:thiamine-phosphate synthase family protein [Methanomicrobium sp.]